MERKVALVTGGMWGICTAISQRLSDNYQTISWYFKNGNHGEAKRWKEAQKKEGFDVDIIYAYFSNFENCEELVT